MNKVNPKEFKMSDQVKTTLAMMSEEITGAVLTHHEGGIERLLVTNVFMARADPGDRLVLSAGTQKSTGKRIIIYLAMDYDDSREMDEDAEATLEEVIKDAATVK